MDRKQCGRVRPSRGVASFQGTRFQTASSSGNHSTSQGPGQRSNVPRCVFPNGGELKGSLSKDVGDLNPEAVHMFPHTGKEVLLGKGRS